MDSILRLSHLQRLLGADDGERSGCWRPRFGGLEEVCKFLTLVVEVRRSRHCLWRLHHYCSINGQYCGSNRVREAQEYLEHSLKRPHWTGRGEMGNPQSHPFRVSFLSSTQRGARLKP